MKPRRRREEQNLKQQEKIIKKISKDKQTANSEEDIEPSPLLIGNFGHGGYW